MLVEYTCQWPVSALYMALMLIIVPLVSDHHLQHVLTTYYVLGTFLKTWCGSFHLAFTTAL